MPGTEAKLSGQRRGIPQNSMPGIEAEVKQRSGGKSSQGQAHGRELK